MKIFIPCDKIDEESPTQSPGDSSKSLVRKVPKYSLHDLFIKSDFDSLSPNYQIELSGQYLEEKFKKKIVVVKKTEIEYMGEQCT